MSAKAQQIQRILGLETEYGCLVEGTTPRAVQRIQARARELKAQGRTADETAATVQSELVAQHPTWARPNGIAALARSAYAEAP